MPDGRDAVCAWYTHCTGNPNAVTVQRGDTGQSRGTRFGGTMT